MKYEFKNPYMNQISRVSFLQRVVIIHSILYYKASQTLISDSDFDDIAKQLVKETNKLSESQKLLTDYWYVVHDFDPSTGFDLPYRLNKKDERHLTSIAMNLIRNERGL